MGSAVPIPHFQPTVPNWIWWGYPTDFSVILALDILVGWGLAGLALAKIVGDKGETVPA